MARWVMGATSWFSFRRRFRDIDAMNRLNIDETLEFDSAANSFAWAMISLSAVKVNVRVFTASRYVSFSESKRADAGAVK